MFHRHKDDEPLSEVDQAGLLTDGAKIRGMVADNQPCADDSTRCRVRIEVSFPDGDNTEFTTELPTLYQPEPGSPHAEKITQMRTAAQVRHATKVPKMQMPLSQGSMVPLRYDPARPHRLVVDEPALQKSAFDWYVKQQTAPKAAPSGPVAAGPPWEVPALCPTCGAPVDQARSSKDADPHCEFCHEPIPVTPLLRH